MREIGLGVVLGLANVLVIAIGLAVTLDEDFLELGTMVMIFGMMPGMMAGAVLGGLARALRECPRALRLLLLVTPALLVVFALASEFGMLALAPVACIPTGVAALVLERMTRAPVVPPAVPIARAI